MLSAWDCNIDVVHLHCILPNVLGLTSNIYLNFTVDQTVSAWCYDGNMQCCALNNSATVMFVVFDTLLRNEDAWINSYIAYFEVDFDIGKCNYI